MSIFQEDPSVPNQLISPYTESCDSKYLVYFLTPLFIYKGLLLIFGAFLAWETRKVCMINMNEKQNCTNKAGDISIFHLYKRMKRRVRTVMCLKYYFVPVGSSFAVIKYHQYCCMISHQYKPTVWAMVSKTQLNQHFSFVMDMLFEEVQ